jgi:two-component system nitrate/nitrite sensor histidine kinase NarX
MPTKLFERSLLLRLGIAMTAIALLTVLGMTSSIIVAETMQGSGAAIDLAGSLRMQSQRIANLILLAQEQQNPDGKHAAQAALQRFDLTLRDGRLLRALPTDPRSVAQIQYRTLVNEWQQQLQPDMAAMLDGTGLDSATTRQTYAADTALLTKVDGFIDRIDRLVKLLSQNMDARITLQRTILGVSLFFTIVVIFVSMYMLHTEVLIPLRDLLHCTERIGHGQFDIRTQHTGPDELGRLGRAFNGMAAELSKLYRNLETRVAEKTSELSRSNRSLELLYHSIARLYNGPVARDTYAILLKDIENVLDIGHGSACLVEGERDRASLLASTFIADNGDVDLCQVSNCAECLGGAAIHQRLAGDSQHTILALPLMDAERQHGVLQLEIQKGRTLEAWQMQLLEALCRHIGTAIGTARKGEQSRRVSLLEERAVIARELHDSLAQSLSFMKIQVSRLQSVLGTPPPAEAGKILAELRQGLNSAYRELRELLTTFRLKIEGTGLSAALQDTVTEFSSRGNMPIQLDVHLAGCHLSANEEIHVLQIVREALSNVVHHAKARQVKAIVTFDSDGILSATVEDDGIGFNGAPDMHHYGMAIMQERARSLGGKLETENRATGGSRVSLSFKPAASNEPAPVQLHGLST